MLGQHQGRDSWAQTLGASSHLYVQKMAVPAQKHAMNAGPSIYQLVQPAQMCRDSTDIEPEGDDAVLVHSPQV